MYVNGIIERKLRDAEADGGGEDSKMGAKDYKGKTWTDGHGGGLSSCNKRECRPCILR